LPGRETKEDMSNPPDQFKVPCVLMRGGTSKALFFHEGDLPSPGDRRDTLLKRAMGTPDVMQIDGLGGSRLVTSKIAIIRKSERQDADVDYTFAQADIERDIIGYDGNCGNISSAVAPFAIDEGLVTAVEPMTTVRIYNTNTDKILVAKVLVADGKARVLGERAIAGVPGAGSEILMDYSGTIGAKTGKLLPTGHPADRIKLEDGRSIEVTVCDAANPCVFVSTIDLGLTGTELSPEISANQALIEVIGEIQSKVGQLLGMWKDWKAVHLPGLPLFVMVAPAAECRDMNGEFHAASSMDLLARLVFLGKCHESMAGTGSLCTAAASRVAGSVVQRTIGEAGTAGTTLRIGHPLGIMEVDVITDPAGSSANPRFVGLGLTRTARRLMEGNVLLPSNTFTAGS
jgi:2-methylaconitate isomerase